MPDIENYTDQTLSHLSDVLMNPVKEKKWFEKNRPKFEKELLKKGHLEPNKIFIKISAIEYVTEVMHVKTGGKKKIEDYEFDIVESIPKTGHVKPKFQFTESIFSIDDYEKILVKFELNRSEYVPVDKYTQIEAFKNALETQFNRQVSEIEKLHQQLAEEFGTLYSQAEQAMLDEQRKNHPDDYKNRLPNGWSDMTLELHSIFNQIQYGMSLDEIMDLRNSDPLIIDKYIDHDIIKKTSENIMRLCRKREPIIEKLKALTKKILPIESLMEDYIGDQEIKSWQTFRRKEALRDMPDPSTFAKILTGKNKNPETSDPDMTTRALIQLRKYLLDEEITDLSGNVEEIRKELIKRTKGLTASKNTIRKWIERYFAQYQENRKARLSNR